MSNVEKKLAAAAPVPKETGDDSLKTVAAKKLGDKNSEILGAGRVTRLGFQFFDGNKPQTAWVRDGIPAKDVMSALMANGHYNLEPAYQAEVDADGQKHVVSLNEYHTQRTQGTAPALKLGDEIEVLIVRNKKGNPAFAYRKFKSGH